MHRARPFTLFLLGLACIISAVLIGFFQVALPFFWPLYVLGILGIGGAYVYFAVTQIERGRRVLGWGLVWLPALALTVTASPDIGVLPAVVAATIEAAVAVGVGVLCLRTARWAEVRFRLPVSFA